MKPVILLSAVFLMFLYGRYYFLSDREVAPTRYEKPVLLRQLALPKTSVPSGYLLAMPRPEHTVPEVVKPGQLAGMVPQAASAGFPQPDEIAEYLVAVYQSSMGEKVRVVTARYKGKDALSGAGRLSPPHWTVVDQTVTWIDSDQPEGAKVFHAAFEQNAKLQKQKRQEWEKVFVAGDAYLKLFINIMVGAFGFLVLLFLVKWVLIVRPTQD
jgi:hypothetical protein